MTREEVSERTSLNEATIYRLSGSPPPTSSNNNQTSTPRSPTRASPSTSSTGQVDSARCRGHVSRLTTSLAPYHRSSGVREFLDRTRPLLTSPA